MTAINTTAVEVTWTVPYIASGAESYVVSYGLNSSALSMTSDRVYSVSDLTAVNQTYSVALIDLQVLTTYFFQVVSTNGESSRSYTNIMNFMTQGGKAGVILNYMFRRAIVNFYSYISNHLFDLFYAVPPLQPTNLMATDINSSSVRISWVVLRNTFGSENYSIQYGLYNETLDMQTQEIAGRTEENSTYDFFLNNLLPMTNYYYQVLSTNMAGSTVSNVATFTTCKILYYNLYIMHVLVYAQL